jgi:hypothetical protein
VIGHDASPAFDSNFDYPTGAPTPVKSRCLAHFG